MKQATITYFFRPASIACDGLCSKAWGFSSRPKIQLSDDEDDYEYLADGELPEAPVNPGTYEGSDGKPESIEYFPNRWCVRECERSKVTAPGRPDDPLVLLDFSRRIKNESDDHD